MIYQKICRCHKLSLLKVRKKWMRSINAKRREVLNFIYLWAKETVKQQGLVKSKIVKSFYFFLSESGGVEKCQLIKTTFQSVRKALQFHGSSTDKPRVSVLVPTSVASISGMIIYSTLGISFPARLYLLHSNTLASLRNEPSDVQLMKLQMKFLWFRKSVYIKFTNF